MNTDERDTPRASVGALITNKGKVRGEFIDLGTKVELGLVVREGVDWFCLVCGEVSWYLGIRECWAGWGGCR